MSAKKPNYSHHIELRDLLFKIRLANFAYGKYRDNIIVLTNRCYNEKFYIKRLNVYPKTTPPVKTNAT